MNKNSSSPDEYPEVTATDMARATYRVGMNAESGHVPDGWPQGEDALVTCTAGVVNSCSAWRIEASGAATTAWFGDTPDLNRKSRGMLFNSATNEILGYYYFSFRIDASE